MQTQMRNRETEIRIHHTRLNSCTLILGVNLKDSVHARKRCDDSTLPRERPARKARASAPTDQRHTMPIRKLHNFDYVCGIAWKHDAVRPRNLDRAVVFVEQQVLGPVKHAFRAK